MDLTKRFEDRGSFINWFIIASLTGIDINDKIKSDPMVVTMQINGEEVNPANSIDRLEQQFDRMVRDTACEMLDDLRYKISEKLEFNIEEMIASIKEEAEEDDINSLVNQGLKDKK